MNLKIRIITRHICCTIFALAFLLTGGLATAEDTNAKSNSSERVDTDVTKERAETAQKEWGAREKEARDAMQQRVTELRELHDRERVAQLENFRKEREQRAATEKANKQRVDKKKAEKGKDKPSESKEL